MFARSARRVVFPIVLALVSVGLTPAQERQRPSRATAPAPDHAEVSYGPHERNVFDLWLADAEEPTPLVVYIHGGGFRAGDKKSIRGSTIESLQKVGISVASIHYRLTDEAPFPAAMHDSARAVQFLRHKAGEYNLDPERIGATGGSAGAGISLWLGFHDDLADPESDDPVLRHSTRLTCMAVTNAQTSYDRRFIQERIGGDAYRSAALPPFWGLSPEEFDSERAVGIYEESSPLHHLTGDDAPAHLSYARFREGNIHSARFGLILQEAMHALGIECQVVINERPEDRGREGGVAFLIRHLTGGGAGSR